MTTTLKAISLPAPYCQLIGDTINGNMQIETEHFAALPYGVIAIHCSNSLAHVGNIEGLASICTSEQFLDRLLAHGYYRAPNGAILEPYSEVFDINAVLEELGRVIAIAVPDRVVPSIAGALYSPSRTVWRWHFSRVHRLDIPVPAKEEGGLWDWEPTQEAIDLIAKLRQNKKRGDVW